MTVKELVPILFIGGPDNDSSIIAMLDGADYRIKRTDRAYIDVMLMAGIGDYVVDTLKTTAPLHYVIYIKTVPVRKSGAV